MDPEQEAQHQPLEDPAQAETTGDGPDGATPAADSGAAAEDRLQELERQAEQARTEAAANGEAAAALRSQLADTLERYRALLLQRDPDVPQELVHGDSVGELESTYERASGLVEQLRLKAAAQAAQERVPAGAPARRGADPATLTPQEKIMLGLRRGN